MFDCFTLSLDYHRFKHVVNTFFNVFSSLRLEVCVWYKDKTIKWDINIPRVEETPTPYLFHHVLQNHYNVFHFRLSPSEWENFKKSKSDCPPCPTQHAFLTGERISRVGCKERPRAGTGAPFTRATLCSSWLCIPATSTPRVRVNTSAGSIYFRCLHSAQQINLFIQTHTEKWLINARARPCFFAFTR